MLIRRYFQLLRQQRSMMLCGIALAVITALAGIALLAVSGWFISATALAGLTVAGAHGFNYFAPGAVVRGLSITRTAGRYGERLTTHEATLRVIARLRAELFGQIANHSWQKQQLNSHKASSQLLGDIEHAEGLYLNALVPALVSLISALAYLLCIGLFLPELLRWIAMPFAASLLLVPYLHWRTVSAMQDQLHQERNQQWSDTSSLFSNLRTLTLFQRLSTAGAQLQESASTADNTEQQTSRGQQRLTACHQLLLGLITLLTLWQGLVALQLDTLAGAELFMLLLLTLGTQEVIAANAGALSQFGLGYRALKRIEQQCTQSQPDDQRQHSKSDQALIGISDLTFSYPQATTPVFKHLDLSLHSAHWHWLTAASGCGKTTLLQLIAGRLQPKEGNIRIRGPQGLSEDIGLMPQRIGILRGSLRYNLCLNHSYTDTQLMQALQMVELDNWCASLPEGLDSWLGQGELMPSGGEIKRLGLARLILQDRPILLLDEPTAGIDQQRAARIFKRLRPHWQDKLVLISSHDRSLITPADMEIEL
ncbi:amino acid ABC transporter ATP-binding/permease protein [Pontibacterium sp.]|uniref:amino acid ABC transporter ATP-binding/permease protein n=1 Tax=Pontibacterium sp. TaxID=2036026 RepID=UPI00351218D1